MSSLIDFSSPTITKNDLRLLKQEFESTADVVNFSTHVPDANQGTDNDLTFTRSGIFQKTKFPPIQPFPSFSSRNISSYQKELLNNGLETFGNELVPVIKLFNTTQWQDVWTNINTPTRLPISPTSYSGFVSINQNFLRMLILEVQNDLDFTSTSPAAAMIPEGFNVLIRSKEGSKFKLIFNDAHISGRAAFISNQLINTTNTWGYSGLCVKDIIFVHQQSNSLKATIELRFGESLVSSPNINRTMDSSATFDVHFDNVDFYYSKKGVHFSGTEKSLQFTNCNFFNSGTATNERAIFMQGVKNLTISKCKFKCLNFGTTPSLVFVFFGDNSQSYQKVTGNLFFDNIIDESISPNTCRQFVNFESAATLLPSLDYLSYQHLFFTNLETPPKKINLYVKDCFLKSASSSHILIYGTNNVFDSFDNIILYNNVYQNNHGKGLLFWDYPPTVINLIEFPTSVNSGLMRGKVYSQNNTAVERNYRSDTTQNQTASLLSLTRDSSGENLSCVYASGKAAGGSTIIALTLDNFIKSSFWVDRPLSMGSYNVLQMGDLPSAFGVNLFKITNLNNQNYNNFKLVATLGVRGDSAGPGRIGFNVSVDGGQNYLQNAILNLMKLQDVDSSFTHLLSQTGSAAAFGYYVLIQQLNPRWSTKLTLKWRRPLLQTNAVSQDPIIIDIKYTQLTSGSGIQKVQGFYSLSSALSLMPTDFIFTPLTTSNTLKSDNIFGRYTLLGSY